jgi:hypothetical protein
MFWRRGAQRPGLGHLCSEREQLFLHEPGVNIEQAQSALDVLYHQVQRQTPAGIKVLLEPGGRESQHYNLL